MEGEEYSTCVFGSAYFEAHIAFWVFSILKARSLFVSVTYMIEVGIDSWGGHVRQRSPK